MANSRNIFIGWFFFLLECTCFTPFSLVRIMVLFGSFVLRQGLVIYTSDWPGTCYIGLRIVAVFLLLDFWAPLCQSSWGSFFRVSSIQTYFPGAQMFPFLLLMEHSVSLTFPKACYCDLLVPVNGFVRLSCQVLMLRQQLLLPAEPSLQPSCLFVLFLK